MSSITLGIVGLVHLKNSSECLLITGCGFHLDFSIDSPLKFAGLAASHHFPEKQFYLAQDHIIAQLTWTLPF